MEYLQEIVAHYRRQWGGEDPTRHALRRGRWRDLPPGFCILQFGPWKQKSLWIYATCGMSCPSDEDPLELHILAPGELESIVELLTAVAHYHRTGQALGLAHTVNFGRAWWPGSACDHGLISLPYLDGPSLEWGVIGGSRVRFLWLLPLTPSEVAFKREHDAEALEVRLEDAKVDYANPRRPSVV